MSSAGRMGCLPLQSSGCKLAADLGNSNASNVPSRFSTNRRVMFNILCKQPQPGLENCIYLFRQPRVCSLASCCPGRRLSTWLTTAVSCPTALGALCGQLKFQLAWCRQHSAVMATELLQPRDLTRGTLFQSSCVIPTSPKDCSDDS